MEQEVQDSRQGAALLFAPAPCRFRLPLHKTEAERRRPVDFTAKLLRFLFARSELLGGATDASWSHAAGKKKNGARVFFPPSVTLTHVKSSVFIISSDLRLKWQLIQTVAREREDTPTGLSS